MLKAWYYCSKSSVATTGMLKAWHKNVTTSWLRAAFYIMFYKHFNLSGFLMLNHWLASPHNEKGAAPTPLLFSYYGTIAVIKSLQGPNLLFLFTQRAKPKIFWPRCSGSKTIRKFERGIYNLSKQSFCVSGAGSSILYTNSQNATPAGFACVEGVAVSEK